MTPLILFQFTNVDKAVHDNVDDDVGQWAGAQFLHDIFAVSDDCGCADVQAVANLLVYKSFSQQDGNLNLTWGEYGNGVAL